MELQLFMQALLDRTRTFSDVTDKPAIRARFPAGGYTKAWVLIGR